MNTIDLLLLPKQMLLKELNKIYFDHETCTLKHRTRELSTKIGDKILILSGWNNYMVHPNKYYIKIKVKSRLWIDRLLDLITNLFSQLDDKDVYNRKLSEKIVYISDDELKDPEFKSEFELLAHKLRMNI